jgi:hypothetical protein
LPTLMYSIDEGMEANVHLQLPSRSFSAGAIPRWGTVDHIDASSRRVLLSGVVMFVRGITSANGVASGSRAVGEPPLDNYRATKYVIRRGPGTSSPWPVHSTTA